MQEKVSIVKCESYDIEEVKKALEDALKLIDFKFKNNLKVFIKPNVLGAFDPEDAITTNPVIIECLCLIFKKFNAEIFIGDSSSINTELSLKKTGIEKIAKKYKAHLLILDNEETFQIDIDSKIKKISLPKIIKEVDLVINVPKLKTHALTKYTGAIKNLYGLIPGKIKIQYHRILTDPKDFSKLLFEIYSNIKPKLNIMDGIIGIEGMGPGKAGSKIKSNLLFASTDSLALDIIASQVIGFKPEEIFTNNVIKKDFEIKISGYKDVKVPYKKPINSRSVISIAGSILLKLKIAFDYIKCIKCQKCGKNCPANVITFHPFPRCDNKNCIKCFCCIEVCPNSAVYLKEHKIVDTAKKIYHKIRGLNDLKINKK